MLKSSGSEKLVSSVATSKQRTAKALLKPLIHT